MSGLWLGTAVFSALKARDFGGFVKSYVWYALILLVSIAVIVWVLRKLGLGMERFTQFEYPPCPEPIMGPSPQGDVKCKTKAGDVRMY